MYLTRSSRCTCELSRYWILRYSSLMVRRIVGPLSRTQAPAFSTALMFAQAYGMLAVSEEDRPFMPVTTVVLEGVPRDMKVLFRHWDDKLIPAAGLMSGKLGRGKSLRIVGLEKAIEATRR
jgi:hypothetical protein